jgi:glutamate dehydrogenase
LGQPAQRARSAFAELNAQGPWTFAKLMLISAELNALVAAVREFVPPASSRHRNAS